MTKQKQIKEPNIKYCDEETTSHVDSFIAKFNVPDALCLQQKNKKIFSDESDQDKYHEFMTTTNEFEQRLCHHTCIKVARNFLIEINF